MNEIAKMYIKDYDFSIITSAKNLINALKKDKNWIMYSYSKSKKGSKSAKIDGRNTRQVRSECYTARFMYKK